MADSFTNNYKLVIQVTGSNSGTWGDDWSNNGTTPLDNILGSTQSVVMSNANINLSILQWQNKAFKITGTLAANLTLFLPLSPNASGGTPAVGGEFVVWNATTGGFSISVSTLASGAGAGVTVPQGARSLLYSDTINVWYANDAFGIPAGIGAPWYGAGTPPPGWLLCFGQSLLRAQYPALFNAIGTTYGSVDGTHFSIPDCRGRGEAGLDNMGGVAANRIGTVVTDSGTIVGATLGSAGGSSTHTQVTAEVGSHGHSINDPGHTHTSNAVASASSSGGFGVAGGAATINPAFTGISINSSPAAAAMAWLQPTIMTNKIIFAGA